MALGAQRGDVVAMVIGESMWLVGIGAGVGLAAAFAAGRLRDPPVRAADRRSEMTSPVRCWPSRGWPAICRRAARQVDPIVALRYE